MYYFAQSDVNGTRRINESMYNHILEKRGDNAGEDLWNVRKRKSSSRRRSTSRRSSSSSSKKKKSATRNDAGESMFEITFSTTESQGGKKHMEDVSLILPHLRLGDHTYTLASICDGHGGVRAATFFVEHLATQLGRSASAVQKSQEDNDDDNDETKILHATINGAVHRLIKMWESHAKPGKFMDGSTVSIVLVNERSAHVYQYTIGDSRSCVVLPLTDNGGVWLTHCTPQHETENEEERTRIKTQTQCEFSERHMHGVDETEYPKSALNMTRSFGDLYKSFTSCLGRKGDFRSFSFDSVQKRDSVRLLIGSDGLFDLIDTYRTQNKTKGTYRAPAELPADTTESSLHHAAGWLRLVENQLGRRFLESWDNVCIITLHIRKLTYTK